MTVIELAAVVPPWTTDCLDDPAWRGLEEQAIGDEMERRIVAADEARTRRAELRAQQKESAE